jgi:hypothetical protein
VRQRTCTTAAPNTTTPLPTIDRSIGVTSNSNSTLLGRRHRAIATPSQSISLQPPQYDGQSRVAVPTQAAAYAPSVVRASHGVTGTQRTSDATPPTTTHEASSSTTGRAARLQVRQYETRRDAYVHSIGNQPLTRHVLRSWESSLLDLPPCLPPPMVQDDAYHLPSITRQTPLRFGFGTTDLVHDTFSFLWVPFLCDVLHVHHPTIDYLRHTIFGDVVWHNSVLHTRAAFAALHITRDNVVWHPTDSHHHGQPSPSETPYLHRTVQDALMDVETRLQDAMRQLEPSNSLTDAPGLNGVRARLEYILQYQDAQIRVDRGDMQVQQRLVNQSTPSVTPGHWRNLTLSVSPILPNRRRAANATSTRHSAHFASRRVQSVRAVESNALVGLMSCALPAHQVLQQHAQVTSSESTDCDPMLLESTDHSLESTRMDVNMDDILSTLRNLHNVLH